MTQLLYILLSAFICTVSLGSPSEVDKVVKDRPQLLEVIAPGDDIWNWLAGHFDETNGLPATWSGALPDIPSHYLASHHFEANGGAVIMVAGKRPDGTVISGEEVLSMLVFELLNASHRDEFKALDEQAKERKIARHDYIDGMARTEFTALLALKQFRVDFWVPHAVKKGLPFNHAFWKQGTNEDFVVYLRTARGAGDGYPDDVYGPRYDRLVDSSMVSISDSARAYYIAGNEKKDKGDLDGALADYDNALKSSPDFFHAYSNRGNIKAAKGDLAGAILDYSAAINLDPVNARYYLNRGRAKLKINDVGGALAAIDETLKLDPNNSAAVALKTMAVAQEGKQK